MTTELAAPLAIESLWATGTRNIFVWAAIAAFLLTAALELTGRTRTARTTGAAAWVVFGVFWLLMFPYFAFDAKSIIEGVLSLAGLPLSLYAAYLLYTGRDSLLILSRAVAMMGLLYLPAMTIPAVKVFLIETVAQQAHFGMELLGYSPGIETGKNGYQSRFAFEGYSTYIVLSCTGIGSISIFGGAILAVRAPLARKAKAFALAVGVIWIANLARNVFVGLAAPLGWFDYPIFNTITDTLAGESMVTSFYVSHHLISQTLSVLALVGITLLVVRVLPELFAVLDEILFVLTGTEYDLQSELAPSNDAGTVGQVDAADPGDD
ncbi:archaeosortase A, PGF-CTERM-specific [Natronoarchaeum philippinense]|uniref:Archaeosortase A, PGF-CTERM-specific n=1 Tax=Natronoarchaeum philippinense TaxID=558529 RepID=A0A285N6Y0_NATPI|nr:archaeosortase A [Natronoarchaeum philippinense]SNZ04617.1 archaeosortase A, PGF-CTERM-specific [Natronoarchaeum philippinense]